MSQGENQGNWVYDYRHIRHVSTPGEEFNNYEEFCSHVRDVKFKGIPGKAARKAPSAANKALDPTQILIQEMRDEIANLKARFDAESSGTVSEEVSPSPPPSDPPVWNGPYMVRESEGIGWWDVVDFEGVPITEKRMRRDAAENLLAEKEAEKPEQDAKSLDINSG